ncbi:cytochrome P450 [Actinomadura sp. 3N508]|uniref:cytochrome P450 n=1 Tax=Actinomadura sp. 3N508 TaxID=3375153 RepID=UPI0037A7E261
MEETHTSPATSGEPTHLLRQILAGDPDVDPHVLYRQLREQEPILRASSGWVVLSRYADVEAALRNRALGKGDETVAHLEHLPQDQAQAIMSRWRHTMVFANPPHHTRLRRLASSAFTHRHVGALAAMIGRHSDQFLDQLARQSGGNFVSIVAFPLPAQVIGELLGVPSADRPRLAALVPQAMKVFEPFTEPTVLGKAAEAEAELADYFTRLLTYKRRHHEDDLLTRLAVARDDEALTDTEMVATAILLLGAGLETTAKLLGNGLHTLLTHPDQLELLRSNLDLMPSAIEEILRFEPPAHLNPRTVLQPCTLADIKLVPGQFVIALLAAANRDPEQFTDPDQFNINRTQALPLSFGSGIHYCLGVHLARLEATVFFRRMLRRYPTIELSGKPYRERGSNLRGFIELPVQLIGPGTRQPV